MPNDRSWRYTTTQNPLSALDQRGHSPQRAYYDPISDISLTGQVARYLVSYDTSTKPSSLIHHRRPAQPKPQLPLNAPSPAPRVTNHYFYPNQSSTAMYRSISPPRNIRDAPGNTEKIDSSYVVRRDDYKKFFRVGRVFATL